MRLITSRSQRFFRRWTAFIVACGLLCSVVLIAPTTAQGSSVNQLSPTEPAISTPVSPDDAPIPMETRTRFVGIQTGLGAVRRSIVPFPYLGSPDAPIKIIQLSSYACSSCRNYYENITLNLLPAIRAGQVQFMLVPVTLTGEYDPSSETAAALCALDQGKFWEMTDVLFSWQLRYESAATDERRLELAALKLGLNADKFNDCFLGSDIDQRIQANNQYFDGLKLQSTPSILINGTLRNPAPSLNQLYQLINQADPVNPEATIIADPPTPEPIATDIPGNAIFTKWFVSKQA
jgi:protein-disulfide isomerase